MARSVVISGGGTGIGLAAARVFAADGNRVLLLGRRAEVLEDRLASPGGRVLFVSSIAAYRGSGSGAYAGAKAALHPYARDLARELGPRGITVNTVAPGYIEDTGFFGEAIDPARRERLIGETFDGRAGTPGDVAATLHWLASPGAAHITSQVVQVNGGAERGN
ncbi:SDR family NAD(P)-dependent oxidoreductase [Streptomyces sp. T028]|uniref:SDR family NAD(P)-dependent oxidoreductase n=1 Tax=Streptomyces sp. T028 TaxID=3394379 RepID=UPI003A86B7E3